MAKKLYTFHSIKSRAESRHIACPDGFLFSKPKMLKNSLQLKSCKNTFSRTKAYCPVKAVLGKETDVGFFKNPIHNHPPPKPILEKQKEKFEVIPSQLSNQHLLRCKSGYVFKKQVNVKSDIQFERWLCNQNGRGEGYCSACIWIEKGTANGLLKNSDHNHPPPNTPGRHIYKIPKHF